MLAGGAGDEYAEYDRECLRLLCRLVMSSKVNQVLSQIRAHFEGTLSLRDHEEGVHPMA